MQAGFWHKLTHSLWLWALATLRFRHLGYHFMTPGHFDDTSVSKILHFVQAEWMSWRVAQKIHHIRHAWVTQCLPFCIPVYSKSHSLIESWEFLLYSVDLLESPTVQHNLSSMSKNFNIITNIVYVYYARWQLQKHMHTYFHISSAFTYSRLMHS